MKHLKVFGCIAFAHISDCTRKMDGKAEMHGFIGYGNNSKGCHLYDEVSNKVITRRDVIFNETEFSMNGAPKHSVEDLNTLFPMESSESEDEEVWNL